ncbi:response regulator [uncultured Nitratireductor sp.]|uniref:response regulator n=1 Tax=uncultured Nitratireductor sp. TaxID=520953 RepID=UPI0025EFD0CC|nr:response regulator [uncultured Nitratireductor sp.]
MKKTLDGARVLLVEDEALIAMNIEELCKEYGAEDVVTVTTFDALGPEVLDTSRISTAILDIKISDNWTDEFARLLQSRHIPFIFATGYAANHQVFEPFNGVAIVEKPYKDSDLIKALAQAIGSPPAVAGDRAD